MGWVGKHLGWVAVGLFGVMPGAPGRSTDTPVDFEREVRPILDRHCVACHGPERQRSGLRLDLKGSAFSEGAYGPVIVPGDPEESSLIHFVTEEEESLRMPPESEPLSADEIRVLSDWIAQGADWPEGLDPGPSNPADHWAFREVERPGPPSPAGGDWARNAIDRFILDRLVREGLSPSGEADRAAWLRRVSIDLTGLPPTPEEIDAFLNDERPDAFERVVDALLASPSYGERWAQHWLDVVRYADTHGFEVNTERPNAWPYRDAVIEAFNADTPYDRFIREQVAGDALGSDASTGFLVTASVLLPGQIGADEPSKRLARQDAIDEIVTNIGLTFLGLSIGCARCHDHMFDPITHADYFGMQAFVAGVEYGDRPLEGPEIEEAKREVELLVEERDEVDRRLAAFEPIAGSGVVRDAVNALRNIDRFEPVPARRLRFTVQGTNRLEPCLDELEVFDAGGRNVALASHGTVARASGETRVPGRHELEYVNDGVYGNASSWMSELDGGGWVELEFPEEVEIDRVIWGRDRLGEYDDRLAIDYRIEVAAEGGDWRIVADASDRLAFGADRPGPEDESASDGPGGSSALRERREALEARIAERSGDRMAFLGVFRDPDVIRRLHRGNPEEPRELIAPATPPALGSLRLEADTPEQERRMALAEWIARPEHPLTARVMVNRIWQGHFGTGIVATPSDFGLNGAPPSHPELLDWLASEFIDAGWSVKHLHRLIVLSSTYRQSSRIDPGSRARDAEARLLWRFPPRRIEAEAIRDAMLAASGRLRADRGGPGFDLFEFRGGLQGFPPVESFGPEGRRRMIYAHKVRRERDAVFGAFDCPDAGQSTARRASSTTPIQALNLWNSRFTIEESAAMADRLAAEAGPGIDDRIRLAYRLTLGRDPGSDEVAEARQVVEAYGLVPLSRALFNSNEFLFLP